MQNPYFLVIILCLVIVISYIFNVISRRTSIPSVLMLIVLGALIKAGLNIFGIDIGDLTLRLEMLGIVGLIMIVLEAALDLEIKKEKKGLILKSFFIALLCIAGTTSLIAAVLKWILFPDFYTSLVYALPLSVMSSAIIIPSLSGLAPDKREFLIYESTFSDILGIMFFYFLVGYTDDTSTAQLISGIVLNIVLTVALSVAISYALLYLYQKLTGSVKFFLLIAVLVLLYSVGKMLHLSSLLIILIFGLIVSNYRLTIRGKIEEFIDKSKFDHVLKDFHMVTLESAFVVRTFFFVLFGVSLDFSSLLDFKTALISLLVVLSIYAIRFIFLKAFLIKKIMPDLFIAPRGLITVLLFFAIPEAFRNDSFSAGILLYSILATAIVMAVALIKDRKERATGEEVEENLETESETDLAKQTVTGESRTDADNEIFND
ncbi:MAG: cation:proton antiporter [Bacteroidales bacterium]|nr:cation:proton antiporter [Bacteroidales bacterium]